MALCSFCKVEETPLYEGGVPVCLTCVNRREAKSNANHKADIQAILARDLTEATLRAQWAATEFNTISGDIPSGIPQPDGTQCIHNASRALKVARDEMMMAHNRLNDFLSRGIVPGDLKQTG
jgi:hypothetical protein